MMVSFFWLVSGMFVMHTLSSVTHPISLAFILVLYSIITGFGSMFFSVSWFFYLLILVFLGGVMVLVIYMSTLSANEKLYFSFSNPPAMFFFVAGFLMFFTFSSMVGGFKSLNGEWLVIQLYSKTNFSSILFLMIYLLITMLCVVKLVKFEEGPLIKRL